MFGCKHFRNILVSLNNIKILKNNDKNAKCQMPNIGMGIANHSSCKTWARCNLVKKKLLTVVNEKKEG